MLLTKDRRVILMVDGGPRILNFFSQKIPSEYYNFGVCAYGSVEIVGT